MTQKGNIIVLIAIVFSIILFLGFFMLQADSLKSNQTASPPSSTNISINNVLPTPTPEPKIFIHPYEFYYGVDTTKSINKLHIISVIFVPKDAQTPKPEWNENLVKVNYEIKKFYEREFKGNIEITFAPVVVKGDLNIEEYDVVNFPKEAQQKTQNLVQNDSYNIWMDYFVRDAELKKNLQGGSLGGLAYMQTATQFEYWLDNESLDPKNPYGITGSAHEFGHALGIPHPWEMEINKNKPQSETNIAGDLMAYQNNNLTLDQIHLRDDVKQAMGLK